MKPAPIQIHTWINDGAPSDSRWSAALREYDEGVKVFTGRWQREAIDELLDYYENDDGEIRQ